MSRTRDVGDSVTEVRDGVTAREKFVTQVTDEGPLARPQVPFPNAFRVARRRAPCLPCPILTRIQLLMYAPEFLT